MIPPLTEAGLLPPGNHTATLEEFAQTFCMHTTRRRELFEKLERLLADLKKVDSARKILIGGSFVSNKPEPDDIDCVIVFGPDVLDNLLRPFEYNVFSGRAVRRMYRIDAYPVVDGTPEHSKWLEFFQKTREGVPVGIVEVPIHD
ncbi:MAG: DUF6932 family protein [Pirellulaceae bacterium]